MRIRCRSILPPIVLILLIAGLAVGGFGQMETASPLVRLERTISTSHALPGSQLLVTLRIEAVEDLTGVGVREILPYGWTIHPLENEGAAFKRSENEWVFPEGLDAGETHVLVYEVTTAPSDRLLSETLPACFEITGMFQATLQGIEIPIPGDTRVELVTALPIPVAVAHLVPGTLDEPDRIDLRLDRWISERQLARALQWWATDTVVPWTEGERIDLAMIEKIIALYETCTPADLPLPQSIDPDLAAIRTIQTFLPCDSVVLPEGCLDPGLSARQFEATVEITGSQDTYGVGLAEWFPETWRMTPVKQTGFTYRPSAHEWVFPERLPAGEKITVTYLVEVVENTVDPLDTSFGCCGAETGFVGFVSSGLECSESNVTGESAVYIWDCLPVLLAISRWNVESDRFDATLSDLVTFPQVQRAVEFWLSGTAVPHTCGYTVGYHTLKTIVAYWLAGVPITQPLPGSVAASCSESDGGCYVPSCPDGGLCHLGDVQEVEDYVGIASAPRVTVEVEGVCELTCAAPTTTLRLTARGGTPPYRYEWWDDSGRLIGTTETLAVDRPGVYNAVVISVGGCEVGQRVVIGGDFEAPQLSIQVDGAISCAHPNATLTASILGGRAPYRISWFDDQGGLIGDEAMLVVDRSGSYGLLVIGANGCENRTEATVLEDHVAPSVDAGPDQVLTCEIRDVILAGSAEEGREPYCYEWTDDTGRTVGSTANLAVEQAGSYTLTVTGANGCAASDTVSVALDVEAPTIDVVSSGSISCASSEVSLRADIAGGRAPYIVTWLDPNGAMIGSSGEIVVDRPGAYVVRVEGANGCLAERTVSVDEDIAPPTVEAGANCVLTCLVLEVELSAEITGGRAPYTVLWRDSSARVVASAPTFVTDRADTYTVIVTGGNGCSSSDSVVVTEDKMTPAVSASVDGVLTCSDKAVSLTATVAGGATPYQIVWSDAQGAVVGRTLATAVSAAGLYTLTVTGANGCAATTTLTVSEDTAEPTVNAGSDKTLTCSSPAVTLTATVSGGRPPYVMIWRSESGAAIGTEKSVTIDQPGTYTLHVTGANGCVASDTVIVTRDIAAPSVAATASGDLTCATSRVTLKAVVFGGRSPIEIRWEDHQGALIGTGETVVVGEVGRYFVTATGANGCSGTATIVVEEDVEAPAVEATVDEVLSCSVPRVTLVATISGGRSPYEILWTNTQGVAIGTSASIEVGEAGRYTATVTGANGCRDTATVEVEEDVEAPRVEATVSGILSCAQPEVTLSAVVIGGRAPYTCVWSDCCGTDLGTGREYVTGLPGTYVITVTGANGCSSQASVEVFEDIEAPTVQAAASEVLSCAVSNVTLSATVDGGRAPFSIVWTDADGTCIGAAETVEVNEPGSYMVTATGANGCSDTATVGVLEDVAAPRVEATVSGELSCFVTEVTLSTTVSGGRAPYAYLWTDCRGVDLGCDSTLTVDAPGAYVVTVTGANGCTVAATIDVPEDVDVPAVQAKASGALMCVSPTATLSATVVGGRSPFSIVWKDPDGATIGTSETVEVDGPGRYTVTVTGANGCSGATTVEVLQDLAPPSVEATVSGVLSCSVTEVVIHALASGGRSPYTFWWTDCCGNALGTGSELRVTAPGTYRVTATGANGCSSMTAIAVTEDVEAPVVEAMVSGTLTCSVVQVVLSATASGGRPPYAYLWVDSDGATIGTSDSASVCESGTYRVTVTGLNGCSGTATIAVAEDVKPPLVDLGPARTLTCAEPKIILSVDACDGCAYAWTNARGETLGTDAYLTVAVAGTYTITVTGANGCCASDSVVVSNGIQAPSVGIVCDVEPVYSGEEIVLEAVATGGATPYTYEWRDACDVVIGTESTVTIDTPGVYLVIVRSATGCIASDQFEVSEP